MELIDALASGSTADVRPVLDRVERELDGLRLRTTSGKRVFNPNRAFRPFRYDGSRIDRPWTN